MTKVTPCDECGHEDHKIITSKQANRFGVVGRVVTKVKCGSCGKTTSV